MRVGAMFVQWRYETHYNKQHHHDEEHTTCRIIKKEDQEEISSGTVKRHVHDLPCKDKARKASLTVALTTIPKEERKPFWEAYRLMTQEPRWSSPEEGKARRAAKRAAKLIN